MTSNIENSTQRFNGIRSRTIFCLWTGNEVMSQNRLKALWSIFKNTGCPVAFITETTLNQWVLKDHPLHPAYKYLSSTHKSDYLRCYLMHHYGGGYSDIKTTSVPWEQFFSQLDNSEDSFALGYPELEHGMPHLQGQIGEHARAMHRELIGLCAFIFKSKTPITSAWYDQLNKTLDEKLVKVKANPGKFSLDQFGLTLPDGSKSKYPIRWAEILGEILHPLFLENKEKLIKASIEPRFVEYR